MISTPKQRQMLGYFRKLLKLCDDTYYDILSGYGVKSSLKLEYGDANDLIDRLKAQAIFMGIYVPRKNNNYSKYSNLGLRSGMATEKQLRFINVKWKQVSNQATEEEKERALNRFLLKITGKARPAFLTQSDVSKVLKAITKMEKKAGIYATEY